MSLTDQVFGGDAGQAAGEAAQAAAGAQTAPVQDPMDRVMTRIIEQLATTLIQNPMMVVKYVQAYKMLTGHGQPAAPGPGPQRINNGDGETPPSTANPGGGGVSSGEPGADLLGMLGGDADGGLPDEWADVADQIRDASPDQLQRAAIRWIGQQDLDPDWLADQVEDLGQFAPLIEDFAGLDLSPVLDTITAALDADHEPDTDPDLDEPDD